MGENNQVPLTENEKALVGRYLKEIREMRNVLKVKSEALDDILGVMIEAKGLSASEYQVDLGGGVIVKRGDSDVRERKKEKETGTG